MLILSNFVFKMNRWYTYPLATNKNLFFLTVGDGIGSKKSKFLDLMSLDILIFKKKAPWNWTFKVKYVIFGECGDSDE